MLIHVVRHGRTAYSAGYRLNGDPRISVPLDHKGIEQCGAARAALPLSDIAGCVCSPFPRARQTGEEVTRGYRIPIMTDKKLGELDYGQFEGRSFTEYAAWLHRHGGRQRPPGAAESQREGITRMITGLRAALDCPGPLLIVTHGLLMSVLRHGGPLGDLLFLPEAPYLTPVTVTPNSLRRQLDFLQNEPHCSSVEAQASSLGVAGAVVPVNVGPAPDYPEKEDSHA